MKNTKYQIIANQIEAEIKKGIQGYLPSVRKLMKQYNASQSTVERGLAIVVDKGLAERIPGKGVYVIDRTNSSKEYHVNLCFFYKGELLLNNPLYSNLSSFLLSSPQSDGMHVNLCVAEEQDDIATFRKRILRSSPNAVILMCPGRVSYELALTHMDVPSFLIFPNIEAVDSPSLLIDNASAMELIVSHLSELGHKKIALLHGQGWEGCYHVDQEERIEVFYNEMQKRGNLVIANFVKSAGFSFESGYQAAVSLLNQSNRPTAIMCNDYNASGVYQAVKEKRLLIPKDISVVGFDNIFPENQFNPSLTSLDIQWQKIATMAIDIISKICHGEDLSKQVFRSPVKLVVRESTGPCR